ncbi:hypothetical protein MD484_g8256, partial [Candolleomyces efflorescens]
MLVLIVVVVRSREHTIVRRTATMRYRTPTPTARPAACSLGERESAARVGPFGASTARGGRGRGGR